MLRNPYILAAACLLSMILVSSLNTASRAHVEMAANDSSEDVISATPGRSIASEELPTPVTVTGKKHTSHATK